MSNVRSLHTDNRNFFGAATPMELVATFGSPLYVYNERILREACRELLALSSHPGFRVNYAIKANTNLELLRIIRQEGCVADAMSPGELHLNLLAGFSPENITYVCNNVAASEFAEAHKQGVLVSVDSLSQLDMFGRTNPGAKVMVRINPGKGEGHHLKVVTAGKATKFAVNPEDKDAMLALVRKHNLCLAGLNQHIGSLILSPKGYIESVDFLLGFVASLPKEHFETLELIDFGGGFGIPYQKYENQSRLDLETLGRRLHKRISAFSEKYNYQGRFYVEPGRYVVAESGVLLGTAHALKEGTGTRYVGTDLGFNVLMRPAMYDSHHDVEIYRPGGKPDKRELDQTIVGNICESGDILAKNRMLPPVEEGDIIGVLDAGAYGYAMASTYNQRMRPAEVLIQTDGTPRLIRRRETLDDLTAMFV